MFLKKSFSSDNKNKKDIVKKKTYIYQTLALFMIVLLLAACSNLDIQTLNNRAAELMQQGDIDGAIARLESIQDLNPNFPQTNYNLGIAYKEKQELDKSAHYLEKSIQLKPDFYQAQIALSVVNEELAEKLLQQKIENLQTEKKDENVTLEEVEFTVEEKAKLSLYYTKAKEYLEKYLEDAPVVEDKTAITEKIREYYQNIEKYGPPASDDDTTVQQKTTEEG
jgi:tetratricopeptide (TPR) repeat protein